MVERYGNHKFSSLGLQSNRNSSMDLGFDSRKSDEVDVVAIEDFQSNMMEFNNDDPHELERCRAVSKFGLRVDAKEMQLNKVLSYVDNVQGQEVEYSLF